MADIEFRAIAPTDRDMVVAALDADPQEAAAYSFATNYVWGNGVFTAHVADVCGCCVFRWTGRDGTPYYIFPFGRGDKAAALRAMRGALERDGVFNVFGMNAAQARLLQSVFPCEFALSSDRDMTDYLYLAADLATLPGGRYQGKRNHVRRFKASGDWSLEDITNGNIDDCRALYAEWLAEKRAAGSEDIGTIDHEERAAENAFVHFAEAGLIGGLLRKAGRPVAFALGERLSLETAIVHFEKALPSVEGASQTINMEFSARLASLGFKYINREEDMGIPNLRRAKMSYHPLRLVVKYGAKLADNDAKLVPFSASEDDRPDIERLWAEVFDDPPEYIKLFLDAHQEPDTFLVVRREGELAAMCALLKAEFTASGIPGDARYIYALATAPKWRGMGLATLLLDTALEIGEVPLILQPDEGLLRDFYVRRGFEEAFSPEEWSVARDDSAASATFRPADADLVRHRRADITSGDRVDWDEAAVAFAIDDCANMGGGALETDHGEIILYYPEGPGSSEFAPDSLRVVETTVPAERRVAVFSALMARRGAQRTFYRNRGAMVKYPEGYEGPRISNGYFNLALD